MPAPTQIPPHKGIILAGGKGTRLGELTKATSKQLLPVYDRPMVHYPLATLMRAGIREILIISTPQHLPRYRELLGDGADLGISLTYTPQPKPAGIAQALLIADAFLAGSPSVLALGDNLFLGDQTFLKTALTATRGATVFTHPVDTPQNYGIADLDPGGTVLSIAEKPHHPRSDQAITGLYILDPHAPTHAAKLSPSPRGELEITELLQHYLDEKNLHAVRLPPTTTWFDAGTPATLLQATNHVATSIQQVPGLEQVARQMGFIGDRPVIS